jgi:Fe(3+) dicitrate transport protein
VAGLATTVQHHWSLGKLNAKLQTGVRYLFEQAFEQRINGTKADARSGLLVNDEIRPGYAFSAFIHNRLELTENWSLTTGLRLEDYTYERNIFRQNSRDTSIIAANHINQLIPGMGINYATPN